MVQVNQYFEVIAGSNLELVNLELDAKGIKFVSRTSKNNGVAARVKRVSGVVPYPPNSISVAVSGSVMESFLQKEPYYSSYHLFALKPKINLTDKQLLYYCMCLKANKFKFSYGRQANRTLPKLTIPSIDEIPSWVECVLIPKKPKQDVAIKKNITLNIDTWQWFSFSFLFKSQRGNKNNRSAIANKQEGLLPVISATTNNNGVIGYLAEDCRGRFPSNCITIANTGQGSVGFPTYQEFPFYATNNITALIPKFDCTKYIGLFLCALIKKDRYKYSWGRVLNDTRINDAKLKLPIDKNGNPDWQFMEDYIKTLPYSSNL